MQIMTDLSQKVGDILFLGEICVKLLCYSDIMIWWKQQIWVQWHTGHVVILTSLVQWKPTAAGGKPKLKLLCLLMKS